jgi:hypothetical protein
MFSVVVATPKSPVEDGLLVMRDTVARRTTFDFGAVSQALCGSACRRFEFVDWGHVRRSSYGDFDSEPAAGLKALGDAHPELFTNYPTIRG